jgi:hypothetical protein
MFEITIFDIDFDIAVPSTFSRLSRNVPVHNLMYETLSYLPEVPLNQTYEAYIAEHLFKAFEYVGFYILGG